MVDDSTNSDAGSNTAASSLQQAAATNLNTDSAYKYIYLTVNLSKNFPVVLCCFIDDTEKLEDFPK